jgi:hypothetical protein
VIQAIGRGRGVNRTADTPLTVFVLADVVLPVPLGRLAQWPEVRPNVVERMAARGVVLRSRGDAHRAFPDLFETPKAAEHALSRAGVERYFPPIPLWIEIHRELGWKYLSVRYRPVGRGQQTRTVLVAPWKLRDLRALLEALVGELALYEVDEGTVEVLPGAAPQPAAEPPGAGGQDPEDIPPDLRPAIGEGASLTPELLLFDVPPPLPPPTPILVPDGARERLHALSIRLDAARPPHLLGDEYDTMREQWWRERVLRARRARMQAVAA